MTSSTDEENQSTAVRVDCCDDDATSIVVDADISPSEPGETAAVEDKRSLHTTASCETIIMSSDQPQGSKISVNSQQEPAAVDCHDLVKSFGRRKTKSHVLKGLDMRVERKSIYALLGPSGCGKTTLLSCIVGCLRPDAGSVRVFGQKPGEKNSEVPGSLVGYMPQDIALYPQFHIKEAIYYFGKIYGMTASAVKQRSEFLVAFFDLPNADRMIESLSGGERRRVSLACALLHKPPLLILDEPTVGVDPVLRHSIWEHLNELTKTDDTSVLMTTHYIEEARQANRVGLMRNGRLLAQASPESLLAAHEALTLEKVFLLLCQQADKLERTPVIFSNEYSFDYGTPNGTTASPMKLEDISEKHPISSVVPVTEKSTEIPAKATFENPAFQLGDDQHIAVQETEPTEKFSPVPKSLTEKKRGSEWIPSKTTMQALLFKNFILMLRHRGALTFEILLPPLQIILFFLTLRSGAQNLVLTVFNEEAVNITSPTQAFCRENAFSCELIDSIRSKTLQPVYKSSLAEAYDAVMNGEAWGVIHVKKNFSTALANRALGPFFGNHGSNNKTLDESSIHVRLDMTNQQMVLMITQSLVFSLTEFFQKVADRMGISSSVIGALPIEFGDPIVGTKDSKSTEFIAPGIQIMVIFTIAMGWTAIMFVVERRQGQIHRSYVAGAKNCEILICYMIKQACVAVVQIVLTLTMMLAVFKLPNHGSLVIIALLCFLQGICGMSFGLLVSCLVTEETSAIVICSGITMPSLLLTGMCWPKEGMSPVLRGFSELLPQSFGMEALRRVMSRGHGLSDAQVLMGFIGPTAWTFVQLISSAFAIHLRDGIVNALTEVTLAYPPRYRNRGSVNDSPSAWE